MSGTRAERPRRPPIPGPALRAAALAYRQAGLLLPPVPVELGPQLRQDDDMGFGTGDLDPADRDAWRDAARNPATAASLAFAHTGYGVNAWQLAYALILPHIAVHLSLPFGGIYGDTQAERAAFNLAVERLEELVVLSASAQRAGKIGPGQRLLIALDSDGGGWELAPGGEWRDSANPLADVLKVLSGAARSQEK